VYDQLSDLTAAQDSAIDAIFERAGRDADRIWRVDFRPVVDSLISQARVDVRAILTTAQEQQLDSLLAARRRRAEERADSSRGQPQPKDEDSGGHDQGKPRP
jgi:hypothetical protein